MLLLDALGIYYCLDRQYSINSFTAQYTYKHDIYVYNCMEVY